MKTVFRATDVEKKGYITEEGLLQRTDMLLEIYPDVDIEKMRHETRRTWIEYCNCGVQVPEGYRLTESQFIQNMWLTIRRPSFKQIMDDVSAKFMEQMDVQKKGHITKEEYIELFMKIAEPVGTLTREHASASFDAIDKKQCGKIVHKDVVEAMHFYYTDTDSVDHPLNLIQGALVED